MWKRRVHTVLAATTGRSQQATDEFLAETGEPLLLLLLPISSGRIAVKPGLQRPPEHGK